MGDDTLPEADRQAMLAEVYEHLRDLARRIEGGRHATLDPTGLVHEAWLKLEAHGGVYADRRHFAAVAARAAEAPVAAIVLLAAAAVLSAESVRTSVQ